VSVERTLTDSFVSRRPIVSLTAQVMSGPDEAKLATRPDLLSVGTAPSNDLVLSDETVSRFHLDLERRGDRIAIRDHGSTNGSFVGEVRVEQAAIPSGARIRIGRSVIEVRDGETVELELHDQGRLAGLVGQSEPMRRLMAQIQRAAKSEVSVLVLGETGSGKEVIAQALHAQSPRAAGPFEIVDCGAMQPTLIGSELFGHEKGAFTGADSQHVGAFERANGGTIFLDEIGELPAALQTPLLGALERRSFRRLGGKTSIPFDARLICATHRDLRSEVNSGSFRQDLFYRIAVVTLRVAPLRERAEDVPLLVAHFLGRAGFAGRVEEVFPERVLDALTKHRWPGNVRELRNAVEAALAMGEAPSLEGTMRPESGSRASGAQLEIERWLELALPAARAELIDAFEAVYLRRLLDRAGGRIQEAAKLAQVDRSYLSRLVKKRGIRLRRTAEDDGER
jgi:DNA-binding NtrC family response regulator